MKRGSVEERSRESFPELEYRVFTGVIDMLNAIFKRGVPIPGVDMLEVTFDPLVKDLIIANLEFLRPVFERRVKDGMGGTKEEE